MLYVSILTYVILLQDNLAAKQNKSILYVENHFAIVLMIRIRRMKDRRASDDERFGANSAVNLRARCATDREWPETHAYDLHQHISLCKS